jgi:hypothetical protein
VEFIQAVKCRLVVGQLSGSGQRPCRLGSAFSCLLLTDVAAIDETSDCSRCDGIMEDNEQPRKVGRHDIHSIDIEAYNDASA